MTTAEEVAGVLMDAADALLIHGRCKGSGLGDDGRSMCVQGAIAYAQGADPIASMGVHTPALDALEDYLRVRVTFRPETLPEHNWKSTRGGGPPAWVWNDTTDDDDEIIDTLRHAAKAVANGELAVPA